MGPILGKWGKRYLYLSQRFSSNMRQNFNNNVHFYVRENWVITWIRSHKATTWLVICIWARNVYCSIELNYNKFLQQFPYRQIFSRLLNETNVFPGTTQYFTPILNLPHATHKFWWSNNCTAIPNEKSEIVELRFMFELHEKYPVIGYLHWYYECTNLVHLIIRLYFVFLFIIAGLISIYIFFCRKSTSQLIVRAGFRYRNNYPATWVGSRG